LKQYPVIFLKKLRKLQYFSQDNKERGDILDVIFRVQVKEFRFFSSLVALSTSIQLHIILIPQAQCMQLKSTVQFQYHNENPVWNLQHLSTKKNEIAIFHSIPREIECGTSSR